MAKQRAKVFCEYDENFVHHYERLVGMAVGSNPPPAGQATLIIACSVHSDKNTSKCFFLRLVITFGFNWLRKARINCSHKLDFDRFKRQINENRFRLQCVKQLHLIRKSSLIKLVDLHNWRFPRSQPPDQLLPFRNVLRVAECRSRAKRQKRIEKRFCLLFALDGRIGEEFMRSSQLIRLRVYERKRVGRAKLILPSLLHKKPRRMILRLFV